MCEAIKKYKGKKTTVIVVWKIFRLEQGRLTSPYVWHGWSRFDYAPDKWHEAQSPKGDICPGEFHAWSTKAKALNEFRRNPGFFSDCVVRPVKFRKITGRGDTVTAREMYIPKN